MNTQDREARYSPESTAGGFATIRTDFARSLIKNRIAKNATLLALFTGVRLRTRVLPFDGGLSGQLKTVPASAVQ